MINEVSIRCFLTVARTLSFTEAAKMMYMTQQSVSKYIARLEEDIGFRLFIRTHHYVMLTKAGEAFFEMFERFDKEFLDLSERMKQYYSKLYNSLRIGHLEWLEISSGISLALNMVRHDNPSLSIVVEKHPQYELNKLFYDRQLDLIITYAEFAPKGVGIKKMKVMDTPLVLLVSAENPRATKDANYLDFRTAPFIKAAASRETKSESKRRALKQCRELDFSPSEIIISPNLESAYMATEFGQGVLVSTMLSRMSLHSKLLCYPVGKTEELQCFWHGEQENPAVELFASCLESSNKIHPDYEYNDIINKDAQEK